MTEKQLNGIISTLEEIAEWMDDRADVDEPEPGHQVPNAEMRFLEPLQHAIRSLNDWSEDIAEERINASLGVWR